MTEDEQLFYNEITYSFENLHAITKKRGIKYHEGKKLMKTLENAELITVNIDDTIEFGDEQYYLRKKSNPKILTVEDKDRLLAFIVNNWPLEQFAHLDSKDFEHEIEMNQEQLNALLMQFDRLGLIEYNGLGIGGMEVRFIAHQEAHDFYNHGGFIGKEQLLNVELKKLELEIKKLEQGQTIQNLTNITGAFANVATVAKLLFGIAG